MDDPQVSIHLITYNHGKFVADALEGVFKQRGGISFEILAADDCSTDDTRDIINKYKRRFPDAIRSFFKEKNVGPFNNHLPLFFNSKGKYVALLEGDDYWTDPSKLEKQVQFLESHPEVSGCFHNAVVVDGAGEKLEDEWFDQEKREIAGNKDEYNQYECMTLLKHMYPTCSLVFRKQAINKLPQWFLEAPNGDFVLDLLITELGSLVYLPGNMAAYRVHGNGMWQGSQETTKKEFGYRTHRILLAVPEFRRKYGTYLRTVLKRFSRLLFKLYRHENYFMAMKYLLIHLYFRARLNLWK